MYGYTMCMEANDNVFCDELDRLKKNFPSAKCEKILTDVDGSQVCLLTLEGVEIKLFSDVPVDAVYVNSDIKIDYLEKEALVKYEKQTK